MSLTGKTIKGALGDFEKLTRLLPIEKEYGPKFRTRALNMPLLVESSGLLPALTFYYAKAKGDSYKKIVESFGSEIKVKTEEVRAEEFSYGAYLYLVLNWLKGLHLLGEAKLNEPLKCFKILAEAGPFEHAVVLNRLMPYLLEIKKLSEARFKPER